MAQCPTGNRYDLSQVTDCLQQVRMVYDAYMRCISGAQAMEVRFQERWVSYNKSNAVHLLNVYMSLRAQCPDALAAMPDLNPQARVRRGPPARAFFSFPRT